MEADEGYSKVRVTGPLNKAGQTFVFPMFLEFQVEYLQRFLLWLAPSCTSFTAGELVKTEELLCTQCKWQKNWSRLLWLWHCPFSDLGMVYLYPQWKDRAAGKQMSEL